MTRPPDRDLLLPYDFEDKFDYDKIQNIVAALEYLRTEARSTGSEEIYTLINSGFQHLLYPVLSLPPRRPSRLQRNLMHSAVWEAPDGGRPRDAGSPLSLRPV